MNNTTPRVSIIVPVHNAGEYIKDCADSLVNQTLKNIEIIFVFDDCSDGCEKYVIDLAKSDPRIKILFNDSNLHIGLSRNRGLDVAQGEYIGFSDHDDWQDLQKYEKLYNSAKANEADIALGTSCYVYEQTGDRHIYEVPNVDDVTFLKRIRELIIGEDSDSHEWDYYKTHGVIWDKIYRREMLVRQGIKFVDTRKITFEDNLFFLQAVLASKRLAHIDDVIYYHRITANNTAATYGYSDIYKVIPYLEEVLQIMKTYNFHNEKRFGHSATKYVFGSLSHALKKQGITYFIRSVIFIRKKKEIVEAIKRGYSYYKKTYGKTFMISFKINVIKTFITIFN